MPRSLGSDTSSSDDEPAGALLGSPSPPAVPIVESLVAARMQLLMSILPSCVMKHVEGFGQRSSMLHAMEIFAGVANIAICVGMFGMQSIAIDKNFSLEQDVCSIKGFAFVVWCLMHVVPGGLVWLAPPCSNWI